MYINTGPGVDQAGRRAVSPSGHQSSFSRLCLTRDEVLLLPQRRYPHYSHRRTLCLYCCMNLAACMKLHQAFVCKFSRKKVLLWPPPQMRNTCLCSYLVLILSSIHVWFLLISLAKVGAVSFACKSAASAGELALMSRLAHGALDWAQQSS